MTRFSGVVLVDGQGRLLLQERDEHAPIDPDKWGFCGGHLEPGEDFLVGAHRELEEETGLRPADLGITLELVGEYTVFHAHTGTDDVMRLFAAQCDLTDADVDCREGRRIVFVDVERARALDLTAAAKAALPSFLASERYAAWSAGEGGPCI
ncbi:NUDIX hydrolase [Nocardioides sp.]|uniref:NUDIX hydrolase n=1 Tax=Nocardioides sp. TaxID=35761 RepID=UPI002ED67BD1